MARKEVYVTIDEKGRDFGKCYKLREWDVITADKWANRAALAVIKAGGLIPDEIMSMGIIGIFMVGLHRLQGIEWIDMEPLLAELLGCVEFVPTPSKRDVTRKLFSAGLDANGDDDIEEVATLAKIRKEVFHLHVNFTPPADQ